MAKKIIIDGINLLATTKSARRYMKYGCNYSLYFNCHNCKNESWYDDNYCNNEMLHFVDSGKTTRVYCENYEVRQWT